MEHNFKIEIISPEKIIFSDEIQIATLPAYEGDMSILKDHIPIITLLRPGILRIQKNSNSIENFFIEDGTAEYFDNNLVVLSASVKNIKNLSREFLNTLSKSVENKLKEKDNSDHDVYILNHKLETLKEIKI